MFGQSQTNFQEDDRNFFTMNLKPNTIPNPDRNFFTMRNKKPPHFCEG